MEVKEEESTYYRSLSPEARAYRDALLARERSRATPPTSKIAATKKPFLVEEALILLSIGVLVGVVIGWVVWGTG